MMPTINVITLTDAQLDAIIERAARAAVEMDRSRLRKVGATDLGAMFGVSAATIRNWTKAGLLPRSNGGRYDLSEVLRWRSDRGLDTPSGTLGRSSAPKKSPQTGANL